MLNWTVLVRHKVERVPRIQNELSDLVRLAAITLRGVVVQSESAALRAAVEERAGQLRAQFSEPSEASELLAPARALYHRLGIDPSKRRPSSEALLRRILQGKGLYDVNTAVDAANLASLTYMLPVGLYDADRIVSVAGRVTLRRGDEGESYAGIGKGEIHLAGRPALVDDLGAFGNPSSDSLRTSVSEATRSLLFVIYAPRDTTDAVLEGYRAVSEEILVRFVGGRSIIEETPPEP